MCLVVKNATPKVAKRSITCYKVLVQCPNERFLLSHTKLKPDNFNTFGRPYLTAGIGELVQNEILNGEQPFLAKGKKNMELLPHEGYCVRGGYIHTFMKLIDAYTYGRWCCGRLGVDFDDMIICKCTIPKGEEYYKGTHSYFLNSFHTENSPSYASTAIKFSGKQIDIGKPGKSIYDALS